MKTRESLCLLAVMAVLSMASITRGITHPDLAREPWRAQLYVLDEQSNVNRYNADGSAAQNGEAFFFSVGFKGQKAGGIECAGGLLSGNSTTSARKASSISNVDV